MCNDISLTGSSKQGERTSKICRPPLASDLLRLADDITILRQISSAM